MSICIPPEFIDEVEKIVDTSKNSIVRVTKFKELFGDNEFANEINLLYEKKLTTNRQVDVVSEFIDDINGINLQSKEALKKQVSDRLAVREGVIGNEELLSIVKDVTDRKYKIDLTLEDATKVNDVNVKAKKLEEVAMSKDTNGNYIHAENSEIRLNYGRAMSDKKALLDEIINPRDKMNSRDAFKDYAREQGQRFSKEKGVLGNVSEGLLLVADGVTAGTIKSVQASMDISYGLRQGFKVLAQNPKLWAKNMKEAFEPFLKMTSEPKQRAVMREFEARVMSSDYYRRAIDSGLAIGVMEEFFPTAVAQRLPGVGRVFQASNDAFTIFSQGSRLGLFRDMAEQAAKQGHDVTPELLKEFAGLANSITGRGQWSKTGTESAALNRLFYSGRFIKSQVDVFYKPFDPKLSPVAKSVAVKASARSLAMMGSVMYTASLFTDVEFNPLSSKFGKAKVPGSKDTWTDLTGGMGSYITAASRIARQKSKSSTTGKTTKLNSGKFGSRTLFDVALDFSTNKLAPVPSTIVSYLKDRDFSGKKPTVLSSAINLATPISAGNALEIFENEEKSVAFIATVFDMLGAGQTDYTKFKK